MTRFKMPLLTLAATLLLALSMAFGQRLVVSQGIDVPGFDPHGHSNAAMEAVLVNLFDYLVWKSVDGEFEPGLATSWEPIADDAWRFTLREGVVFHDGTPFTGEDVKFTLERLAGDDGLAEFVNYRQIREVEVVSDHEIVIHTDGPDPLLVNRISRVGSGIVSKDYVERVGWEAFATAPIGTGPFQFVNWIRDQEIEMAAFDDHWRGRPAFDTLLHRTIPEDSTRVAELMTGGVDIITNIPEQDQDRIGTSNAARVELAPSNFVMMVVFNVREGTETADPLIREAIDLAIDRDLLVDGLMGGLGVPTAARLNPGISAAPIDRYFGVNNYDPERARELIAEAGYAPGELTINMYGASGRFALGAELTEIVGVMLEEVGFSTNVDIREFSAYSSTVWNAGAFEHMVVTGLGNSFGDNWFAMRALLCGGQYDDRVGWCNERFDELMNAAETEVDPTARAEMLHEATDIVAEERPWITLFQRQDLVGVSSDVEWTPRADGMLWMFEATPAN
ncbi:ABC transporter substrate-binding protein [soil metagenome]|nr:ABC transporter substrate-binding protein [Trueperaceae bacterium]